MNAGIMQEVVVEKDRPVTLLHFPVGRDTISRLQDTGGVLQLKPHSQFAQLLVPSASKSPSFIKFVSHALHHHHMSPTDAVDDGDQHAAPQLYLAVRTNGRLLLRPVEDVYALRPVIADSHPSSTCGSEENHIPASQDSHPPNSHATTAQPTVVTIVRKRETDEQLQARLSSYAHLQQQLDSEPWQTFDLYPIP
jgi:hypothetical protein